MKKDQRKDATEHFKMRNLSMRNLGEINKWKTLTGNRTLPTDLLTIIANVTMTRQLIT